MSGYVYFIRPIGMPGPVKIGHSHGPVDRLAQLNPASPYQLELAVYVEGNQELERNIQNCFADVHSHCEWFHPAPRLLTLIAALQVGTPVREAIDLTDIRGNVLGMTARATAARNIAERQKRRVAA
jgi:hypothetical protein